MAFSDTGIFQIYAGTDPARVQELVPVVCNELHDVTKNICSGELARAKAQCRADLLMGQESVMRRAEIMGHQLACPLIVRSPIDEILKKLMAVTVKDVKAMAVKLISHKPILTALGPLDKLEDYKSIVKRLAR